MFSAEDWSRFLSEELGVPVRVRFGRARHRVLEAKPVAVPGGPRSGLSIRLSWFFESAPVDVREAVARWLRSGKRARRSSERLDRWIADTLDALPPAPRRAVRVETRGHVHDLAELTQELLVGGHVSPEPVPRVTWGKRRRSRARHSLQLGSYQPSEHLVRVHPVLDQTWVPAWFVRYVLFHELLHAALPPAPPNSPSSPSSPGTAQKRRARTVHHGPEFKRRERAYPDYERALLWQERFLPTLLRSSHVEIPPAPEPTRPKLRDSAPPAPQQVREPDVEATPSDDEPGRQGLLFAN